jgi:hypothetical protein
MPHRMTVSAYGAEFVGKRRVPDDFGTAAQRQRIAVHATPAANAV